jgi:peptide/nickel transport system ATP-binding protein
MNSLNPVVRVGRQVVEVLVQRGDYGRQRAHDRAAELFQMVSIDPSRLHDYPHQFSGGMRQRAVIALSLALNPALIIADEPVTALDVIVQRQVLDIFKELQVRLGLSVILVTHDISVVAYACDRVAVMYAGKVVESGPTGQVLTVPCHPYTMGLYNAFPELQQSTASLISIRGSPPSPVELPAGCRFEARCPFALPLCRNVNPLPS